MKIYSRMVYHPILRAGGAERQMLLLGSELTKKDIDFHYISGHYKKNQEKFKIFNGIKIHILGSQINPLTRKIKERILNLINSYDILIFFKYFRKMDYDICHMRSKGKLIGVWNFFTRIIKKKKFVFTLANITDELTASRYSLSSKIYEYGVKRADVIIVLADYMKNTLYQKYGLKSVVIKSGHPIPKGPFKKEDPPTILWISRLVDWKRPELFLKIAKELNGLDAKFILIGPMEYKKNEIIMFAKKHKNFTFIPGIPFDEDNYYYEKASLFVNTSLNQEGYPNSFIQAWMYETPIISLDVDPDCDICKNNLGYHAKGDINTLINKIKELIENPIKLREMGKRCRKYAIQNHNIKKTAEQNYRLYNWLLKNEKKI